MDLFEIIGSLSHLLLKYGGHKYACGISLEEENLPLFARAFEGAVEGNMTARKRVVQVDTAAAFDELTTDVMDRLEELGPFGIGNPRPNLLFDAASVVAAPSGRTRITDGDSRTWYGFYASRAPFQKPDGVRVIASPVVRMEMGERFIHLNIKEMQ
jgi:single-stranded-DNA-specific exonuclease